MLSTVDAAAAGDVRTADWAEGHSRANLLRKADGLAHVLAARGIAAGQCVGLVEQEEVNTLLALWALYKIGAVAYFIPRDVNALRRRFLRDSASLCAVLDARRASDINLTDALAELEGKECGAYPAPAQRGALLRVHVQHASGKLLAAQLDQPALSRWLAGAPQATEPYAVWGLCGLSLLAMSMWRMVLQREEAGQDGSRGADGRADAHTDDDRKRAKAVPPPLVVLNGKQLAPVGTPGELCVGGLQLLSPHEDLLAQHPLLKGERWVRTGHRAARHKDGTWRLLHAPEGNRAASEGIPSGDDRTRLESRLATRSETLLRSNAQESALTLVPSKGRWTAFVERKTAGEWQLADLLAHLKQQPQPEWLPTSVIVKEQLPRLAHGAVDRDALLRESQPEATAYVAPQGPTEELLAELWSELLKCGRVSRHANFFQLGGYSLMAAQLISRIRDAFATELTLRELFAEQELQGQARLIEQKRTEGALRLPAIEVVPRDQRLPLSFAQQRLWFIDRLEGGSAAYHMAGAVRLHGDLDRGALRAALDAIVQRHEVLRTTFRQQDAEAVQQIAASARFQLRERDFSQSGERGDPERAVEREASEEGSERFDLSTGPLIRGRLLKLADDEHVLLVTMHHIVSDGWSLGVLIRELSTLYAGYREGRVNPLSELKVQYADYARWQRQWLQGEVLAGQLAYWQRHLHGAPALLELPTDRMRPAIQRYRGGNVGVALSAELSRALKALSQRQGTTLFMTLYSGFALLLSRLSGQRDVVIGTAIANRQRTEVEGLIGFFVNTLALRAHLTEDLSVSGLLAQVKETTLGAYAHQETPFEHVVEALQPQRSLSYSPVFQVMFALQNAPQSELRLPGLRLSPQPLKSDVAQFDMTLSLQEMGDEIVGIVNYASDLFEAGTVERWVDCLKTIYGEMARDADQPLKGISVLSARERDRVLREFNATEAAYPRDTLIHELFEEQARRTPGAPAVADDAGTLTYAELNAQANQLARYLRGQGVGPDQLVAICLERGSSMVVGLLGILKAGGAYVPLDPSYPPERLQYMLEDAAPRVVLTQESLRERLPPSAARIVSVESAWPEMQQLAAESLPASETGVNAAHLAYLIYTSGSTGMPKGVMIEHRNTANLLYWAREAVEPTVFERTLASTSLNFDLAVYECFVPLSCGGCVRVAGNALQVKRTDEITLINTVPSAMNALLESAAVPPSTRVVNLAGEALKQSLVERIFADTAVQSVCNLYGPSETTTYSSWVRMRREEGFNPTIGRPVANTQIYLLDSEGQPVPLGVVGEIHIGGAGVARGYLNREELTSERFLKDPFSADERGRMYKTGDLGRWRTDGTLEYLGRNDHQVKLRGFRIELGEIESRLLQHSDVQACVVVAREDEPGDWSRGSGDVPSGDKRLVAYFSIKDGTAKAFASTGAASGQVGANAAALSVESLREHLRATLPEYMVPAAFVHLEQLPLTPNGKIDRKALPAPGGNAYSQAEYESPRGEIEEQLAQIWQGLLKVARVGRQDNFFELGGHSLLTLQLIERLRQVGLHAQVQSVFKAPALKDFAATLQRVGAAAQFVAPESRIPAGSEVINPSMLPLIDLTQSEIDEVVAKVPGGARNIQDLYPLAPLQEGILFHHALDEGRDPYVLPLLLEVDTREKLAALLSALQGVIDRHDILRTAVLWRGLGRAVQVVSRQVKLPVQELIPDGDALRYLRTHMAPGRMQMDLEQAPLLRMTIARGEGGKWYALILLHHLAVDHVSLERLLLEVAAHVVGRQRELLSPMSYREYVAQALARANSGEGEAFFRRELGDVQEPTAPFGLLNVHGDGSETLEAQQPLEPELARRIRRCARRLGVSAATLFHVAYALVVARASGRDEVVFGSVLSGRLQGTVGAGRALGMFINTLPVRIALRAKSALEVLQNTRDLLIELVQHEQMSLTQAQQLSGMEGTLPLFSAVLNYRHSAHRPDERGDDGQGIRVVAVHERTNYPFALSVDDFGDEFALSAQTDREIDPRRVTGYVQRAVDSLVQALEEAPDTPALHLAIIPENEHEELLRARNATAVAYPKDTPIQALFEAQVERAPRAIAIQHGRDLISYEALERQARAVARWLRREGVQVGDRVGICMDRSISMVAAMVGVLKAGGTYVPIDPNYPRARIEYIIGDAAPAGVLTARGVREQLELPPRSACPWWCLDEVGELPEDTREADERLPGNLAADHAAYVIYTSGSTGVPKGVVGRHGSVVNRLLWLQDRYPASTEEIFCQKTSIGFVDHVAEIFQPLTSGGRLVILEKETVQSPPELLIALEESGTTRLTVVPSLLHALLRDASPVVCRSMRLVISSGEALILNESEAFRSRFPQARLLNLYGSTEVGADVTSYEVHAGESGAVAMGRPIANSQAYVLSSDGELLPRGATGELFVGGEGLAQGYWKRGALTAERFVPDVFGKQPGARLFRTGDLVRYRENGELEYLGRADHQVKIRGMRIELGEIEARLSQHPDVAAVVVVAREDEPGDRSRGSGDVPSGEKRLVAYFSIKDGTAKERAPSVETLREHLRQQLPEYMVPAALVLLEQLPLTPSGKVDRKALPAPGGEAYARVEYEAPQGEIEAAVAQIWQGLLQVDRVGRRDDFFELGGHSLLAVQVASRVRQVLGRELAVRAVFEHATLQSLGAHLRTAGLTTSLPIERVDRGQGLPLSWAQERLWFIDQLESGSAAYHMAGSVRLHGELDKGALRAALDAIVERHEALRTTFGSIEGQAIQHIAASGRFALRERDLSGLTAVASLEQAVEREASEEGSERFDLNTGPLIRGRLLRLGSDEHVLLVTMHHIVSDGWSMGIFIRELSALYAAYREGRASPLSELQIHYADYAQWQRKWLQGEVLQEQLEYWKRHLTGAPALLELPADRVRPAVQQYRGGHVAIALGADLSRGLKELSQRQGTTSFMTLYAGFALLLSKLSGQGDIVIGTAVANRQRTEVEGLIGFFVNTLALRARLSDDLSVSGLLAQVKSTTLGAYAHQETPFEQVVEALQPERSLSHSPVFQVMFTLQNAPQSELKLPGLRLSPQPLHSSMAQFDLTLSLQEAGDQLVGVMNYASDLFARGTIERWAEYLKTVYAEMVRDAHQELRGISGLDAREQERVLREFNATEVSYPRHCLYDRNSLLHELFEDQVKRTPEAIAVVAEEESLTYAQLNARANQLAHYLRAQDVGPDRLVAICFERGLPMVVGLLGVLKAGGAYVPLDPSYPPERVQYMLQDAAPRIVLTQESLRSRLSPSAAGSAIAADAGHEMRQTARIVYLDSDWDQVERYSQSNLAAPEVGVTPSHLAYVIYTSGSTGLPKGVMVEQRAVVNFLHSMQRELRVTAADRLLAVTTLSFDIAGLEIYLPLISGARCVLASRETAIDATQLIETLDESAITLMQATPATWRLLLAADWKGRPGMKALCGGEALPGELAGRIRSRVDELWNLYGPTETTIWSTSRRVPPEQEPRAIESIGCPIANTQIYILNSRGRPVPIGVSGEVYIGGAGVARGYLHRPALTAERFTADPFGIEGGRLYKTGDLGRWLADGSLEYVGRNDHQVKVRGVRIELGEIESRLSRHPSVAACVVVAREDEPGDWSRGSGDVPGGEKRLVAYYIGKDVSRGAASGQVASSAVASGAPAANDGAASAAAPSVEVLREYLRQQLPEYMMPTAFVVLEQLPLTPNGKVDRKALPAPGGEAYARVKFEEPAGEIETALAQIWQSLLKLSRVGRQDNFFELGGHSLLAVQVVSRVRQLLGRELAVRAVFEHSTLQSLGAHLRAAERATSLPIVRADRARPLPLSWAQERLWFIDRLEGGSAAYHMAGAVRLHGELDREALRASLDTIVERHEVLRTRFQPAQGRAIQEIAASGRLLLQDRDLTEALDIEQAIEREANQERSERFDLSTGPLIRGRLLKLRNDEHVLLVTMHHIISDGWSIGIFIRELSTLYAAYREGRSDPLPALAIQYADYAQWQRHWLQGEVLQGQLGYWKQHLQGAPSLLTLPADRVRPAVQRYRGSSVAVSLGAVLSRQLREVSQREGTTLFMTLYAGFALLLSKLAGQREVVIGTAIANRSRTEVEGLIGFFVNTLALRSRLSEELSVSALLAQVKETTLGAYAHQETPFEQVVEALQPERSLSHSPVFQVMFALQNAPQSELKLPGLKLSPQPLRSGVAQFDLTLSLQEVGEEIAGVVSYASDLFEVATVERWVEYLKTVYGELARDTQQRLGRISMLSAPERERVLRELNTTGVAYPREKLIHGLFEEQARKTPQAIAVVDAAVAGGIAKDDAVGSGTVLSPDTGARLTYAQLNARANQLARYLRSQGVEADQLVAICLERGVSMVVGLLGILKAGGAYVPLDPSYPQERLEYMLEDAAPAVVVTQESLRSRLPESSARIVCLDSDWDAMSQHAQGDLPASELGVTASNLAYVIYTSGSTGLPKGTAVVHRNVVRLACNRFVPFEGLRAILCAASPSFDAFTFELWGALLHGKRSVLFELRTHSFKVLGEVLHRHEVDAAWLTAGLFNQVVVHEAQALQALKYLLVGGEALSREHIQQARQAIPDLTLVNGYGPTENTTFSCTYTIADRQVAHLPSIPIGRAIDHSTAYVLDGRGEILPIGCIGELYVGGDGLARAYLNKPALTAEKFVPHPFSAVPGARLYRTGDLVRCRGDGNIEFIGRNDTQVKIRGFRIELGEIESRLSQHPGVRSCVVVAREDEPRDWSRGSGDVPDRAGSEGIPSGGRGEKRLVAYYTRKAGGESAAGEGAPGAEAPNVESLREHLRRQLPEYMVPAAFVELEQLPLTPNGKVDRKALPAPGGESYARVEYEAPQGEVEEQLARIWQELLKVERVGRQDNFFELGGHSLLTVQLTERLRQVGLHAQVQSVFKAATLRELAGTLEREGGEFVAPVNRIPANSDVIEPSMLSLIELTQAQIDEIVARVPGRARNVQDIYPLAPLQEGILFHHVLDEGRDPYVLPILLEVESRERLEELQRAFQAVIDRHDVLRTAVLWKGLSKPVQVVQRQARLPVQELCGGDAAESRLKARMQPGRMRMEVESAPLLRMEVAQDGVHGKCYVLIMLHHLVIDHVSLDRVLLEVAAHVVGRAHELLTPMPYREYVAQALSLATSGHGEAFFRRELGGMEEPTAPYGLLNVHGDGSETVEGRQAVEAELGRKIRRTARRLGVSAATLFHVAYALVVARTSGRDEVVFGSVLSGRLQGTAGAGRALGMFINTLPIRVALKGRSAREVVEGTREVLIELVRHEQMSLTQAQKLSGLDGALPLFSAVLNYRHSLPAPDKEGAGEDVRVVAVHERTNYPFTVSVDDFGEGFGLSALTDAAIDARRVTGYVHRAVESLVEALEQAPETPALQLSILPADERAQLLQGLNATGASYPHGTLIHELFEDQVRKTPQAIAVVDATMEEHVATGDAVGSSARYAAGDAADSRREHTLETVVRSAGGPEAGSAEPSSLTYAELNARANQLAGYLRSLGVRPDQLVAICLERGASMVVALLGILKAGGAYVPLDPNYPKERLEYMLADAAPAVVVTQQSLRSRLPETSARIVCLDSDWGAIGGHAQDNLPASEVGVTASHLAYVIYTSGSTGQPKGVMIEHRNTANLLYWAREAMEVAAFTHTLASTSLNFDLAVYECFVPLSLGGSLRVSANAVQVKPSDEITLINTVPSALSALLESGSVPASTRVINLAGEALKGSLVERIFAETGVESVCNLYGPSETTTYSTWVRMRRKDGFNASIGRPVANTQIYVLDSEGQPTPQGIAGEIYIGGAGVARGYLNRPELTAERFLKDPFSTDAQARMYKTGDVGRWLPDGTIEYLGRNDHQVKIRGFRIELGEIESRLGQHPGVQSCVVVAREDEPGDWSRGSDDVPRGEKRLVAYYTQRAAAVVPSVEALREHLRKHLPQYMVPAAFVHLEQLPLTPNGKLDRARLSKPEKSAYGQDEYVAPANALEERLAQLWQDNLGVAQVGTRDNYFALGGDSIRSISLVAAAGKVGVVFRVKDLFAHSTIAELARAITDQAVVEQTQTQMPEAFDLLTEEEKANLFGQFS